MGGDGVGVSAGGFGDLKRGILGWFLRLDGRREEGRRDGNDDRWIDRQIGMRYEGEIDDDCGILIKS